MTNEDIKIEFICPSCKGVLFESEKEFHCSSCNSSYPKNNKIIDFRGNRQDYYFNPISSDDMDGLIKKIKLDTWVETVQTFIKLVSSKRPAGWIDNLVVDGRYAWKFFLNLNGEKTLLDIGCGLGNLVSNLAPHMGKTYAMDLTYKRLEFAEKRIAAFNASDDCIFIAGGDQQYLPFPDNSIDCVTLSGVLEWIGEGDSKPYVEGSKPERLWHMLASFFGKSNPRNIQIVFLKEIKRVLKNDGQLFVAIENRLNYEYFTGRADHHSGLKYGSLLPRFVANLYSILVNRKPYRTYTYSIQGYKGLFKHAGYESVEFIGLTDGYTFLKEMYPAEINIKNWKSCEEKNIKDKIRSNKYFVPAYGIIASLDNNKKTRLQDKLFNAILNKLGNKADHSLLALKSYSITSKEKLIIKARINDNNFIIKIPFNKPSLESQEKNKMLLESTTGLPLSPRFVCQVNIDELKCFVEEEVKGESIALMQNKLPTEDLYKMVARLLEQINPKESFSEKMYFSGIFYDRLVEEPLNVLFDQLKDQELDDRLRQYFTDQLKGSLLLSGIYHGDLAVGNILVDQGNVCHLIDWEAGMIDGLPILDSIKFVGSFYRYKNQKARTLDTVNELLSDRFKKTDGWYFLEGQYKYFDIDPSLHEGLVYLSWLLGMAHLFSFSLKFDSRKQKELIYEVAKKI